MKKLFLYVQHLKQVREWIDVIHIPTLNESIRLNGEWKEKKIIEIEIVINMHVVVEIKVFDVFGQRPKVSIMKILCNLRDEKGWENGSLVLKK